MATQTVEDVGDAVRRLSRRIYNLEQLVTGPSVQNNAVDVSEVDEIAIGGINIDAVSEPPTGLTLASGAFLNRIYIDVSWTAPDSPDHTPAGYWVEWAKKNADGTYQLPSNMNVSGTSVRIEPVDPNSTYGVRVRTVNRIGVLSDPLPAAGGYQDIVTGKDTQAPPAVTNLVIGRGATSAVVKFTPLNSTVGDPLYAPDVADGHGVYEVQIDNTNLFNTAALRSTRTTSFVVAFNDLVGEANWYARVRAIDESGNAGPWVTAGPALAGSVVDAMIVSGLDAAKITFGSMSGDRIQANSLQVSALTSGSLTSQSITLAGGSLIAGSTFTGVVLNSQGLTLYNAGSMVVRLDAFTGAATFKGTIDGGTIIGQTAITIGSYILTPAGFRIEGANALDVTHAIRWTRTGDTNYDVGRMYCVSTVGALGGTLYIAAAGQFSSFRMLYDDVFFNNENNTGVLGWTTGTNRIDAYRDIFLQFGRFVGDLSTNEGGNGFRPSWDGSLLRLQIAGGSRPLTLDGFNFACGTIFANGGVFTTKPFRIHHPIPEKSEDTYLFYSSVEGPRPDLIFRGVVQLADGKAEVDIDAASKQTKGTFNALTRNPQVFLYNMTGEGTPHGNILDGHFIVECRDKTAKIGWMVVAERKDRQMIESDQTDSEGNWITEKPVTYDDLLMDPTHPRSAVKRAREGQFLSALDTTRRKIAEDRFDVDEQSRKELAKWL